MSKTSLFIVLFVFLSGAIIASDSCHCERANKFSKEQSELIEFLEATDLDFAETFVNEEVSEVIEARYFYCADDHGYLYIKLQNKEKLYKDVPLQTWFDFKFNDAMDSFYISHIKYNYIPV
jgi:hypothetical protein